MAELIALLPLLATSGVVTVAKKICRTESQDGQCVQILTKGTIASLCLCCLASTGVVFFNRNLSFAISSLFCSCCLAFSAVEWTNPTGFSL